MILFVMTTENGSEAGCDDENRDEAGYDDDEISGDADLMGSVPDLVGI